MSILVTGCGGFIGSNYTEYLLKKDYEIIGFDDYNNFYSPLLKKNNVDILSKYNNFEFYNENISGEQFKKVLKITCTKKQASICLRKKYFL